MLFLLMEFQEDLLVMKEKAYWKLFKKAMSQAFSVHFCFRCKLILAECEGGDKELKPHQVPVDFYTSGVSCGQCQVVIADPWFEKLNNVLSFEDTRL